MQTRLLLFIFLTLILAGCKQENDPRLDLWEQEMATAPDSVRQIIEATDVSSLSTDYDRARYSLLRMMARDKCYLPLKPDSALNEAAEYFHKRKDLLNETKARYYAGLAERHVHNYQKALWETLQAIDRAHESADTFWMGRVHNLAYEIYMSTYDCKNAAMEADKASIYFKHANSEPFHRYALLEKAKALNFPTHEDGSPIERGINLLDSLKNVSLRTGDSALAAECLYHKIYYYYRKRDYSHVQGLIDSISTLTNAPYLTNLLIPFKISLNLHNNQSVAELIESYSNHLFSRHDSINYIHKLREIESTRNNWELAYRYADSIISYYSKIMGEHTFKSLGETATNYQDQKLKSTQEEQRSFKRTKRWIIVFSILICSILIYLILFFRSRNKRKEEDLMSQLAVIAAENDELQLKIQEKKNLVSEIDLLKAKIETQERLANETEKLKNQLNSQTSLTSEINTLQKQIDSLKEEIAIHKERENLLALQKKKFEENEFQLFLQHSTILGNRIDAVCELAMNYYECDNNDAYKNEIYNRVAKEIKGLKSEKFLKELECNINDIHNDILTRLQQQLPVVTKDNLRWIALIIGGIQPKTISFLLNMKIHTLYTKRLRVRSYIEKSDVPDKNEFLKFFLPSK